MLLPKYKVGDYIRWSVSGPSTDPNFGKAHQSGVVREIRTMRPYTSWHKTVNDKLKDTPDYDYWYKVQSRIDTITIWVQQAAIIEVISPPPKFEEMDYTDHKFKQLFEKVLAIEEHLKSIDKSLRLIDKDLKLKTSLESKPETNSTIEPVEWSATICPPRCGEILDTVAKSMGIPEAIAVGDIAADWANHVMSRNEIRKLGIPDGWEVKFDLSKCFCPEDHHKKQGACLLDYCHCSCQYCKGNRK